MQATLFEFRNRWWIIGGVFFIAFGAYFVDPVNSGVAIATWLAKRVGLDLDTAARLVFGIGALLLIKAASLRTWGTSYLQPDVMRDARIHTERLLADGPYRYVRNPLYLGNILLAAGIGLMASRLGFLILFAGMTTFVLRLLLREERELSRDLGESYRRYCAAVPRLFPSFFPRVAPAGNAANWPSGFRAELMYWLIALAMIAFAVTLNIKIFWVLFAIAFASSWFYKRPETKQSVSSTPRS